MYGNWQLLILRYYYLKTIFRSKLNFEIKSQGEAASNYWTLFYSALFPASYALLISIEFSFHFSFLWYSRFVINFPHFFKRLFRPMKIPLPGHSQNNYQIWLYRFNLMGEELSYQIINTSAVNQVVFCY